MLAAVIVATAPDGPTIAVCAVIAVLSLLRMFRSARAGVEVRDAGLVVRGVLRTRTIPWSRIERAVVTVVRGRTTLTLHLAGRARPRHVEELSARGQLAAVVVEAATAISRRLEGY